MHAVRLPLLAIFVLQMSSALSQDRTRQPVGLDHIPQGPNFPVDSTLTAISARFENTTTIPVTIEQHVCIGAEGSRSLSMIDVPPMSVSQQSVCVKFRDGDPNMPVLPDSYKMIFPNTRELYCDGYDFASRSSLERGFLYTVATHPELIEQRRHSPETAEFCRTAGVHPSPSQLHPPPTVTGSSTPQPPATSPAPPVAGPTVPRTDPRCSGNACEFIQIRLRNKCIVIFNSSSQAIAWKPNELYLSYDTIYAQSEFTPMHGFPPTNCTPAFNSTYSANFR